MPVTLNDYIFHQTDEPPSKVRAKIVIEYDDGVSLEYYASSQKTLTKLRKLIRAELPNMAWHPILKEPGLPPMRVKKVVGRNPSHFGEALGQAARNARRAMADQPNAIVEAMKKRWREENGR